MDRLTPGKIRGLQQLASPRGILVMCAADHRDSLKRMLGGDHPEGVSYPDMVEFKLDLCRAVAPWASAILLDPVYGAGQAIAARALPGSTGLLVSMEETGYAGTKTERLTRLLPGWSVEKARRLGASAAKLLIYYRPDQKETASKQLDLVKAMAEECLQADMLLLVETVTYPVSETPQEFARIKPGLVVETARQVSALPIDVLKAEFPGDMTYEKDKGRLQGSCRRLNEASRVPWVLLSAGVDYELFKQEVELACRAGASGFLAGRALWQEAPQIRPRSKRVGFLETIVPQRLRQLAEIAESLGTPWHAKLGAEKGRFPQVAEGWYTSY